MFINILYKYVPIIFLNQIHTFVLDTNLMEFNNVLLINSCKKLNDHKQY